MYPSRKLKIHENILFTRSIPSRRVELPEIRLMGKWLAECGFRPGQIVEVRPEANKLTIVLAEKEWCKDAIGSPLSVASATDV